jgi:coenzyme F420-0:L-glutamate ligase / coenzyme F420-1:gamma-L-glutamate ligase
VLRPSCFFVLRDSFPTAPAGEKTGPIAYTFLPPVAKRSQRRQSSWTSLQLLPIAGLGEIRQGHDLASLLVAAADKSGINFANGDILAIAQKIVSKAEGRIVDLSSVWPSPAAQQLAAKRNRDPRLVEVVLRESRRIVREDPVIITETHHGFVCANSGVDHSNVAGDDFVTLLPLDPDLSAARLAAALRKLTAKRFAVLITDTFGRPWRLGLVNVTIGAAGLPVLLDLRGKRDRNRKRLQATIIAVADELAAAAGLLMGKAAGIPAVIIRGYKYKRAADSARRIIRPPNEDLFR